MDARRDSISTLVREHFEEMAREGYPPLPLLVESGEYSDFNIACDGKVYKLHQAIVCPQSRVIKAAGSAMQGAASKTMHIGETDTFTIRYVIMFLYEKEYEIEPPLVEEQVPSGGMEEDLAVANERAVKTLLAHIRVGLFAFHHEIEELSDYSDSRIKKVFDSVPANRLPAFLQKMDSSTADLPRHWASACDIGGRIQERAHDLYMAPGFSRLNVDRRILLETIKACAERIHFLEHACEVTREMYMRVARELGDDEAGGFD